MKLLNTTRIVAGTFFVLAVLLGLRLLTYDASAQAQQPKATRGAAIPGITRQPSDAARDVLLDPNDTVVVFLDHQTGLFQTVKDVPLRELRANTVVLAKIAELGKAPIIYTASEPGGTNGPIMEELAAAMPNAKYIARKGEISAWDNADFVKAVEATGKKTIVIAGVWTSVCVAFPALQAKADGYKVYAVMDASGDMSQMASDVTLARLTDGTRVSSYNPWLSLYWLVSGKTVGGTQLFADDNRLTRDETLKLFTVGSAWLSQEEKVKGRIAPGQYADFAVLNDDYFTVPEEQIKGIHSLLTVVGGKVVYAEKPFEAVAPPALPPVSPQWSPVAHFGGYQHPKRTHRRS